MTAADIAAALGGHPSAAGWYRSPCPVHGSRGDTLALKDGATGLVVHCHAHCREDDVVAELQLRGLVDNTVKPTPRDPQEAARRRAAAVADRKRRIARALNLWRETVEAAGTLVETYCWSRLLCMAPPPTIRLHWNLWHRETGERRPAMVGLVKHVEFGRVGVHATYLAPDGSGKASLDPPRKCFGPVGGGAVRLAPIGAAGQLVVGEGIETVLSVMISTGLPGWAALSATGLQQLVLPREVHAVIIAADHDENGIGQAAAAWAAARFTREGRRVKVATPPTPGDFNDLLLSRMPSEGPHAG
jgi:hypothetical protein